MVNYLQTAYHLVKNFFDQDAVFNKPDNRSVKHPVDVFEDENGLTFEVACTGLDKSDVDITIEGDILKISYDKGEEKKSDSSRRFYHSGIKKLIHQLKFEGNYKIGQL